MFKRLFRHPRMLRAAGHVVAWYLKFVWLTSRKVYEPDPFYHCLEGHFPFIVTFWHGQHFMVPFGKRRDHPISVMISRHGDGEINAVAVQKLGFGLIRGSGDTAARGFKVLKRGGALAFRAMLKTLQTGVSVAQTADVPKKARVVGEGIILLAAHAKRPIVPVAIVTSARIDLDSWDKASFPLPFGTVALVAGRPMAVPASVVEHNQERDDMRLRLEDTLNNLLDRAYALAEGRVRSCTRDGA